MTCQELAEFLDDYVSGDLPVATRALFEQHLDECPNCVHYLANYRDTIHLSIAAFNGDDVPLPTTIPDALVNAILAATTGQR